MCVCVVVGGGGGQLAVGEEWHEGGGGCGERTVCAMRTAERSSSLEDVHWVMCVLQGRARVRAREGGG